MRACGKTVVGRRNELHQPKRACAGTRIVVGRTWIKRQRHIDALHSRVSIRFEGSSVGVLDNRQRFNQMTIDNIRHQLIRMRTRLDPTSTQISQRIRDHLIEQALALNGDLRLHELLGVRRVHSLFRVIAHDFLSFLYFIVDRITNSHDQKVRISRVVVAVDPVRGVNRDLGRAWRFNHQVFPLLHRFHIRNFVCRAIPNRDRNRTWRILTNGLH